MSIFIYAVQGDDNPFTKLETLIGQLNDRLGIIENKVTDSLRLMTQGDTKMGDLLTDVTELKKDNQRVLDTLAAIKSQNDLLSANNAKLQQQVADLQVLVQANSDATQKLTELQQTVAQARTIIGDVDASIEAAVPEPPATPVEPPPTTTTTTTEPPPPPAPPPPPTV